MRKLLFAAIATLAVAFGNLAAASAAPQVDDGSAQDQKLTGAEQAAARQREADLIGVYVQRVAKTQGWDATYLTRIGLVAPHPDSSLVR